MRRAAALLLLPMLAVAAAGCSSSPSSSKPSGSSSSTSSSSSASTSPSSAPTALNSAVIATGAFGSAPKVTIPAENPGVTLYSRTLVEGTGAPLTKSDSLLGNFVLYDWRGTKNRLLGSTFSSGSPTLFSSSLLPGLEQSLVGKKAGSRVLVIVPPADGFGPSGNPQIGVGGKDTLVFVVDMIQDIGDSSGVVGAQTSNGGSGLPTVTAANGKAPSIAIPVNAPPKTLQIKTLIKGAGHKVISGEYIVVQYTGVNWRTKKIFDSSWSRSQPFPLNIAASNVIVGWVNGLVGQTVGSRVLLVIPPALGYGKTGQSTAGIKGTDTLVFVVDILAGAK